MSIDWQFFEQFVPMIRGVCRKLARGDRALEDFMFGFIAERWPGIDAAFRGEPTVGRRFAHLKSSAKWYACKARRRYHRLEDKPAGQKLRRKLGDEHSYTQLEVTDEVLFFTRGLSWKEKAIVLYISRGYNFAEIGDKLGLSKFTARNHARRVLEQIRRRIVSRDAAEEGSTT